VRHTVTPDHAVELVRHPATPSAVVRRIAVQVARTAEDLRLAFVLDGDLARLRIPLPGQSRMGQDLWRHTCFEAFVGLDGSPSYHELNCAPSSEWAVLAFRAYREGGPVADATLAPRVVVERSADRLALEVEAPLARLAPAYATAHLRLGLAAVVEDGEGGLSYWSLHHPPGRPDFHHPDAFALRLEPLDAAC